MPTRFEKGDIVLFSQDSTPRQGVMRDEVYFVNSADGSYVSTKTICSPDLSRVGSICDFDPSTLRKATRHEQVLALLNVAERWRDKARQAFAKYDSIIKNVETIKKFRSGVTPDKEVFGKLIARTKAKGDNVDGAIAKYMLMTANFKDLSSAAFKEAMSGSLRDEERSYKYPADYAVVDETGSTENLYRDRDDDDENNDDDDDDDEGRASDNTTSSAAERVFELQRGPIPTGVAAGLSPEEWSRIRAGVRVQLNSII